MLFKSVASALCRATAIMNPTLYFNKSSPILLIYEKVILLIKALYKFTLSMCHII